MAMRTQSSASPCFWLTSLFPSLRLHRSAAWTNMSLLTSCQPALVTAMCCAHPAFTIFSRSFHLFSPVTLECSESDQSCCTLAVSYTGAALCWHSVFGEKQPFPLHTTSMKELEKAWQSCWQILVYKHFKILSVGGHEFSWQYICPGSMWEGYLCPELARPNVVP